MRNFIICCFGIFTLQLASAQVTIEPSDLFEIGDTVRYSVIPAIPDSFDFSLKGADLIWDFSKLDVTTQSIERMVNPTDRGYQGNWCLLNFIILNCLGRFAEVTNIAGPGVFDFPIGVDGISDVTWHYKTSDTAFELTILGITASLGTTSFAVPLEYENPDTIYHFPIEYLNRDSSNSNFNFDASNFGQDFAFSSKANRVTEVEGWGTLITP
ncbi:MAG: hypothetical protein AAGK97_18190, partial [Bacteroidota bacterium]